MSGFFAGGFLYNPASNKVLLHQRDNKTTINPNKWAFFGGLGEANETPIQAFMREMQEELGLNLKKEEVMPLRDYPNMERGTHRYVFYVVSNKKKEDMVLGEGANFDWFSFDKALALDTTPMTIDDLNFFINSL
jgi:ADP-ribose pyrophosphatase YjhB (NUDIX family)